MTTTTTLHAELTADLAPLSSDGQLAQEPERVAELAKRAAGSLLRAAADARGAGEPGSGEEDEKEAWEADAEKAVAFVLLRAARANARDSASFVDSLADLGVCPACSAQIDAVRENMLAALRSAVGPDDGEGDALRYVDMRWRLDVPLASRTEASVASQDPRCLLELELRTADSARGVGGGQAGKESGAVAIQLECGHATLEEVRRELQQALDAGSSTKTRRAVRALRSRDTAAGA